MNKFFAQNILLLIVVNLLVKPIWVFAIDRNVQNYVGHEQYGLYQALFNFCLIFQILLDFGLHSYNTRIITGSPKSIQRIMPNIIFAKLVLSVIYIVIITAIGYCFAYRGFALIILLLIGLLQILNSFTLYFRSNVAAMHEFKKDSLISISDRIVAIIIAGLFLFHPLLKKHFSIEWFVIIQIIGYAFSLLLSLSVSLKYTEVIWSNINIQQLKVIFKQGWPYALVIFQMSLYFRSDVFILERMLHKTQPEQAGIYAAAYRLLDVSNNLIGVLLAGMLLSIFGKIIAKKEPLLPTIHTAINIFLPISLIASVICLFYGQSIMEMLYTNSSAQDGLILFLLFLSFPCLCLINIFSPLLTANKNIKFLNILSFAAVVISITLNIILVQRYFAIGTAITMFCVQFFLTIVLMLKSKHTFKWHYNISLIMKLTLFSAFILLDFYVISFLHLEFLYKIVISSAIGIGGMLVFKLVPAHSIRKLLRGKLE